MAASSRVLPALTSTVGTGVCAYGDHSCTELLVNPQGFRQEATKQDPRQTLSALIFECSFATPQDWAIAGSRPPAGPALFP